MRETDKILINHTQKVRIISTRLRELIHSTAPNIKETCYPLVHAIGFEIPQIGNICGILPLDDSVCLTFKLNEIIKNPENFPREYDSQCYINIDNYTNIPADHIKQALTEKLENAYDSINNNSLQSRPDNEGNNNNSMHSSQ